MQMLYTISFVAGFTIISLLLCWLIYKLSGKNFWNILKWVKYTLIVSSIISFIIWIIIIVIKQNIDFHNYSFMIVAFCLIFDLLSFLLTILTKKRFNQKKRLTIEDAWNKMILFCTLNIIAVPVMVITDICFFISSVF